MYTTDSREPFRETARIVRCGGNEAVPAIILNFRSELSNFPHGFFRITGVLECRIVVHVVALYSDINF
jgi:hypothetical protein